MTFSNPTDGMQLPERKEGTELLKAAAAGDESAPQDRIELTIDEQVNNLAKAAIRGTRLSFVTRSLLQSMAASHQLTGLALSSLDPDDLPMVEKELAAMYRYVSQIQDAIRKLHGTDPLELTNPRDRLRIVRGPYDRPFSDPNEGKADMWDGKSPR